MPDWAGIMESWPVVKPSYNVAPTSNIPVFRQGKGELMRWGLIPKWSDTFDSSYATFNARIETVHEKPAFKSAWKNGQRCLIPMAGYYEWKGEKGNKQPYYVTDRFAGGVVAAGIYESWKLDKFFSCTMITKEADEAMANLHSRIPLLLTPESARDWLSCTDNLDHEVVASIVRPKLSYYKVGKVVGNSDVDNADLIEPKRI